MASRQLAQSIDGCVGILAQLIEDRPGTLRIALEESPGQAKLDLQGDQVLLRAIMLGNRSRRPVVYGLI